MAFRFRPWRLYFSLIAGWVNRQQQKLVEYLQTENQVLKEKLGKKRILLNDDQRCRLAVKGRILGRKRLKEGVTFLCGRLHIVIGRNLLETSIPR